MSPEPRRQASDRWLWPFLLLGAAAMAGITAWARTAPEHGLGALSQQDPGAEIHLAYTIARWCLDLACVVTVGALASVAFLTRSRETDLGPLLTGRARRRMVLASRWAAVWVVAALACILLSTAYDSGQTLAQLNSVSAWWNAAKIATESPYFVATAIGALVVCISALRVTLWRNASVVLVLGLFTLWPTLLSSHMSSDIDHDIATGAIMVHVPAAVLWCGLLLWVLIESRHGLRPGVWVRYGRVAGWCWFFVGASGLVLAGILNPTWDLDDPYARLLLVKAVLFVAVIVVATVMRRRALADGRLRRVIVGEFVLLIAAVATAAAMSTVTPATFKRTATDMQSLIGFDIDAEPTWWRLVSQWRLDPLMLAVAIGLMGWYARLWRRIVRADHTWSRARGASWMLGCLVVVIATCSGLATYEPAMFSIHMASDALLQMVAPILLALGAPLTLARSSVHAAPATLPDARDWVTGFEQSWLVQRLTQPFTALLLFQGLPFAIYFTDIFDITVKYHWAHLLLSLYFLLTGYLFAWVTIGIDQTPRPTPAIARLGVLLASMPITALFAGVVMSTQRVLGNGLEAANMYTALALPWVHDLHDEQRTGGLIALIIGEAAVTVALLVLLRNWWRYDEPTPGATS